MTPSPSSSPGTFIGRIKSRRCSTGLPNHSLISIPKLLSLPKHALYLPTVLGHLATLRQAASLVRTVTEHLYQAPWAGRMFHTPSLLWSPPQPHQEYYHLRCMNEEIVTFPKYILPGFKVMTLGCSQMGIPPTFLVLLMLSSTEPNARTLCGTLLSEHPSSGWSPWRSILCTFELTGPMSILMVAVVCAASAFPAGSSKTAEIGYISSGQPHLHGGSVFVSWWQRWTPCLQEWDRIHSFTSSRHS